MWHEMGRRNGRRRCAGVCRAAIFCIVRVARGVVTGGGAGRLKPRLGVFGHETRRRGLGQTLASTRHLCAQRGHPLGECVGVVARGAPGEGDEGDAAAVEGQSLAGKGIK